MRPIGTLCAAGWDSMMGVDVSRRSGRWMSLPAQPRSEEAKTRRVKRGLRYAVHHSVESVVCGQMRSMTGRSS